MDVLHDNSMRGWVQLGETYEQLIPSYVMESTLPDKEAASKIDDALFADDARHLFPVDSPEATWLSAAYFCKNRDSLPYKAAERDYVWAAIKTAATAWGIAADVQKIANAITEVPAEKTAEDEDANYGWVMRDDTGAVVARKYPMFDSRGVKLASDYFDENRAHYPVGVRRSIARNIMRKAAEYGIDTDGLRASVLREAGFGIPRKDILMEELLERAHLAKDAEAAILLANINEMVAALSPTELGDNLDKIAEVVDAFDTAAGLNKYYGTRILMPADFLYDINLKAASAAVEDSVELRLNVYSLTKLATLPTGVYGDVLGPDFVTSITKKSEDGRDVHIDRDKLADSLYALSTADKAALEEHLMSIYA